MNADDEQPDQHGADEHDESNVKASMKGMVAEGGAQEARAGAHGAHAEVELFGPAARDGKKPEQDRGSYREDAAEYPGASGHGRGYPDSRGGSGRDHLAEGDQQEDDRMHERHDSPLAVREDGELAHIRVQFSEVVEDGDVILVTAVAQKRGRLLELLAAKDLASTHHKVGL